MGLQKGKTNNPNGRPAGSPNKVTKELRTIINDFLNDNIEKVQKDFSKLQPRDRVRLFIDLLQYAIPKCRTIDTTINTIEDRTKQIASMFPTQEEIDEQLKKENS